MENRNCYGYTEEEVRQAMRFGFVRQQEASRQEEIKKAQELAAWDNFLNVMCGTGIVRKI